MDEEGIDRIFDEGQLQPLPFERSVLDRSTIEVGLDAARSFSREAHLRIPIRRTVRVRDLDKIGRTSINRHAKAIGPHAARQNLRLEVAGDETLRLDPERREMFFEEISRRVTS